MTNRRAFFSGAAALAAGTLGAPAAAAQTGQDAGTPATCGTDPARDLATLSARALRWSGPYPANWVRPRDGADRNVVVLGAGHSGLGIAHGLKRKGIGNVAVIDQAEPGNAGIWRNIARMQQLRTPKALAGPESGNVLLGFRAWYETQHGAGAFDALDRIQRLDWADYLAWFQRTTSVQVRYGTRLVEIEPADDLLRLHLLVNGTPRVEVTRKLVLANGYAGAGGPGLPDYVKNLPPRLWTHSTGAIPFDTFRGKVIAVVGAGANAFDAAGVALESGAAEVHLFDRRSYVDYALAPPGASSRPATPPAPVDRGFAAVTEYNCELPDIVRWRNFVAADSRPASVPYDSMMRAVNFRNFHLHLDTNLADVAAAGNRVSARANGRAMRFDHLISGTGYPVDLSAQPELKNIHQAIESWRDRFTPPAGEQNAAGAIHPYLGGGFEFLPRAGADRAAVACLRNVHCFNLAAQLSYGILVGDIPSMVYHPRVVAAVARDLYQQSVDVAAHERFVHSPLIAPDPAPYQQRVEAGGRAAA